MEESLWDAYNLLSCSSDVDRFRKLLARSELFRKTITIPGDIVECGVFKGTGFMQWLKFLKIFSPGTLKKVIGFDTFGSMPDIAKKEPALANLFKESGIDSVPSVSQVTAMAKGLVGSEDAFRLVEGDIKFTAADYVKRNPGFRISLLHLDMDVDEPTFHALEAFYSCVTPGGLIVFDEYAIDKWTESQAVTKFFADKPEKLHCLPWAKSPTAYCVKV
eukprot:m.141835 g.141835  ORF g.141835 m.141835 type:complete len:218 (+) comp38348_c1_seq75:3251-3904(+)